MKNRLFSKNFFLVAVLVCIVILNLYPQKNYNAIMNPSKAIASTTDDVAEQVLVKSADDVAGRVAASSADDIVGRTVASSTDDIAVSATAGSRQAEKQLLSGSEWNEYFQQTYGAENVQWATQGQSSITNATKGAGSGVKTDFVVTPKGEAIPIPKGATGPVDVVNPAGKTTGFGYTGGSGGANGQVSSVRIMDPTPPRGNSPGYPNGYVKYQNNPPTGKPQGVDPVTGQTLPNFKSHFPLK